MIDLVYLLGNGSKWDNNELRYSLRSVEKHFTNVGKVWVVGEMPMWLRNATQIPYRELPNQAAINIAGKIFRVAQHFAVSTEFMLMSDDYFILRDFDAERFPLYHQGWLADQIKELPKSNYYKAVLENTVVYLKKNSLQTVNYNVHMPMIMDKDTVTAAIPVSSLKPIASKSVYGNYCYTDIPCSRQLQKIKDVKLRNKMQYDEIKAEIQGWPCFSTGNHMLNGAMKQFIDDLYPLKSRFEI